MPALHPKFSIRRKIFFPILIGLIFLIPSFGFQSQSTEVDGDAQQFVQWVKERALHLDTLDWQRIKLRELSFLDKLIKDKKVVYLGEPDHYIHEKYDFRLILIRYLYEKGFRYIGMEMGLFEGRKVDKYLETGDSSYLDKLGMLGYKGIFRKDRDDTIQGFPARQNQEFRQKVFAEKRWFFAQLRSINAGLKSSRKRIHWFGYDVDYGTTAGYDDAKKVLEKHRSHGIVVELLARLELISEETIMEENGRIKEVLKFIERYREAFTSILGEADFRHLMKTLRCLEEGLRFIDGARLGPSPRWLPSLIEREKTMFRQMDELLEELDKSDRIILMGHNMHLSKDYKKASFQGAPMWRSIGTHVSERLPGKVFSIWMLYDHGRHANMMLESAFEDVPSHPSRIESLFAQAGSVFLLPFHSQDPREKYVDSERYFVLNGRLGKGYLKSQADAVFFVSEVTALRER